MYEQQLLSILRAEFVVSNASVRSIEIRTVREDVGGIGLIMDLGGSFEHLGIVRAQACVGQQVEKRSGASSSSKRYSAVLKLVRVLREE